MNIVKIQKTGLYDLQALSEDELIHLMSICSSFMDYLDGVLPLPDNEFKKLAPPEHSIEDARTALRNQHDVCRKYLAQMNSLLLPPPQTKS